MKRNNTYKIHFDFFRVDPFRKMMDFYLRLFIIVSSLFDIVLFIEEMIWRKLYQSCLHAGKEDLQLQHYVLVNKLPVLVSALYASVSLQRYGFSDWTLANLKAAKVCSSFKKGPELFAPGYTGFPGVQFHSMYHNSGSGGRRIHRL